MKKLLVVLLSISLTTSVLAGGVMKEICKDKLDKAGKIVVDKKTGKPVQECKTIKVHKKLEGKEVPVK